MLVTPAAIAGVIGRHAVADGEVKIDKPTPEVEVMLSEPPTKSEPGTTAKSRKSKKKSHGHGSS